MRGMICLPTTTYVFGYLIGFRSAGMGERGERVR